MLLRNNSTSRNKSVYQQFLRIRFTGALLALACISCHSERDTLTGHEFSLLMGRLENAWSTQNTDSALACFAEDATYMQPPDEQFYKGHEQLRLYFGALKSGTFIKFHNLWFDEVKQIGAGEFTFGNTLTNSGVSGIAVVVTQNRKIKIWREYFIKGPLDFNDFISTENKKWKWHIGNYP